MNIIFYNIVQLHGCCFSSVTKSFPTLCDPMECSMPGFLVLHSIPEFVQLMSIESVMLSNHLILCCPLLPSIFSSKPAPCIRELKYWNFSFSISPSNEYSGLISFNIDWFDLLQSKGLSRVFSNTLKATIL